MPTYVYRCKSCGHQFEAWQHMTDDPLTTCPQCGSAIHRVVFPTGILFKGSGFYTTDARRSSATDTAGANNATGASNGSTPDAPAAKSDTPASTNGATAETKSPAPAATETKS